MKIRQTYAYGPNGFVPAPGDTVTTLYAPLLIKERTTGKVLAKIINNGKGGRMELGDANGYMVAAIGTSPAGTGSVAAYHATDVVALGYLPSAVYGGLQTYESGKRVAELAPGKNGQMGLRIFNPSGAEVATLEDLPGGSGGGGLMIHNATGGSAATIATGKNGVGIIHGILAGPAIGAAW